MNEILKVKTEFTVLAHARKAKKFLEPFLKFGDSYNVSVHYTAWALTVTIRVVNFSGWARGVNQETYKLLRPRNISDEQWNLMQNYYRVNFCRRLPVQEFYGSYGAYKTAWRHGFGYDFF